jgi:F420-non-reducing hydrogenase iron-sulfur subunit
MNPMFVLRAFQRGADGVLVAGCHPGDCHYSTGNYHGRRRLSAFKRLVEFAGFEPNVLKCAGSPARKAINLPKRWSR